MNSAKCRSVYTTYYCSYLKTKNVLVTEKNYFIQYLLYFNLLVRKYQLHLNNKIIKI